MKLQGMYAAAATPFDHSGQVWRVKVQHNFDKWSRTSLAGFVVGTLAGEGPLLEPDEKIELLRVAREATPAERTMILDVSCDGVHVAGKLARRAAEAGADAVVCVVPHEYRNMMSGPETQALFYRALADQSPVPVILHNAPLITSVDLGAETVAELSQHPNIAGIIEAGWSATRVTHLRSLVRKEFAVLAGLESQVWDSLKAGASGAVLPFASAAPYATIAIWEAFRTREEEAGVDWQARITHPGSLVTDVYGVAGLKYAMDLNGYYGGPPRLPFVPVSADARREIEEAFRDLKG